MMQRRERILVVEDEAISARALAGMLGHLGYGVVGPAASGEEALRQVAAEKPDLVLMDIMLQGALDGVTTAQRIRDEYDVPVVYVTAHSDDDLLARVQPTEPFAFITKPVEETQLRTAIPLAVSNHLTRRELKESEKRYRELWIRSQRLETMGYLSAGLAHDFNNVLTVILGHAALLLSKGHLTPQQSLSAQQIRSASNRGSNLTRQLLAFTRRETLHMAPVDLNQVVAGFTRMIQRLIGETVSLEFEQATLLPAVLGDTGMLEQVLMNLAVNARDAMPRGGRLRVRTFQSSIAAAALGSHPQARPAARAGDFVCLQVSDEGSGMDETTLRRLFEPFYTTKRVGEGTGLGLATVLDILNWHKGWIDVSSAPGQGTTFTIYLPPSSQQPEHAAEAGADLPVSGRGELILVVEDAADVRELLRSVLEGGGYQVTEAESGLRALELWKEWGPRVRLLLTDIVLPEGMSGLDLAAKLRVGRPTLKVIYTSAYDLADIKTGLLREGINFLKKPFLPDHLTAMIRTALDEPA